MKKILKKTLIFIIGLVSILILLEIGLRIFGSFYHVNINKKFVKDKESTVILTIGDSFTFGIGSTDKQNYPNQLQQLLNQNTNRKFTVVNAGLNGQNTAQVLEEINENISVYKPEIIVLMIGGANFWNYYGYSKSCFNFINNIRVFKLIKLLYKNISEVKSDNKIISERILSANDLIKERKSFEDNLNSHSKYSSVYNNEGVFMVYIYDYPKAIEWFKKKITAEPKNYYNYEGIVYAYISMKNYNEAIETITYAINKNIYDLRFTKYDLKLMTYNIKLYNLMGYVYSYISNYKEAINYLEKGLSIDSTNGMTYFQLAKAYIMEGEYNKAKDICIKGISVEPKCRDFYDFLNDIKQNHQSKDKFKSSIVSKLDTNINSYSYIDSIDMKRYIYRIKTTKEETGFITLSDKNIDNDTKLISKWIKKDIESIINICKNNNVKLILMNYPVNHTVQKEFPANYIVNNFKNNQSIYFIDNTKLFDNYGIAQKMYFVPDGHCNNKGYEVMAKNIYDKLIEKGIIKIGKE